MKRSLVLGGLIAFVLAGCGALNSLIPAQPNPIGLQGQSFSIPLGPSTAAVGSATLQPTTFADIDPSKFNSITPKSIDITLEFASAGLGGSCPAASNPPATINVSYSGFDVTLSDSGGTGGAVRTITLPNPALSGSFTLTKSSSGYSVSNVKPNPLFSINGSDFTAAWQILTTGGQNTVSAKASFTTTSTPDLAGCTLTLTMGGGQGKVNAF